MAKDLGNNSQNNLKKDVDFITQKLGAYNRSTYGPSNRQSFAFMERQEGEIIAGASGFTQWGWLYLQILWVDEKHRGQGLGQKLLKETEEIAQQRDCLKINVDTFGEVNRGFYERNNYEVFGQLDNYPEGYNKYFLKKMLV